jgi:putative oxidoreductase
MNTLLRNITASAAGIDTLPVRIAVGIIFAAHGAQKLFGWFGGKRRSGNPRCG